MVLPSRAFVATMVLAVPLGALAGCVTSEVEPREDAKKGKLVNLATLVPGVEPGQGGPAYYYWSGLLEGSWAAFRFDVPRDAIVTPPQGSPYAKIHAVTAIIENGAVVEEDTGRGGGLDPNAGAIAFLGYAVAPSGEAFEGIGRVNSSLAPEYGNWTLKGIAGAPVQNDTLLLLGALAPLDDPGPLNVAVLVRIGGPEMVDVRDGSMWDTAVRELAEGREAKPLRPVAQGGGFGASLYLETPLAGRESTIAAREVTVNDRSSAPPLPGLVAQRVLDLSVRRSMDAPSRVILASGQPAGSAIGSFNWTYAGPDGATAQGDHGVANVALTGAIAGVAGLMNAQGGDLAFDITFRTTAGALVQPLLLVVTLGIDVPAVYGRPTLTLDPTSSSGLPGPVQDVLKETSPPR